jgi:hypothetical protein
VLLCLGLGCARKATAPVDPSSPPPRAEPAATAEAERPAPEPPADVAPLPRATENEPPRDLLTVVSRDPDGQRVRASRPGFLVALRRGEARAVGEPEARLLIATAGTEATPIVWETTKLDTLATTRGTIDVDGAGVAHVTGGDAPRDVAEDVKRGHRCRGHEDGAGGFTVLCRTGPIVAVRNLATDEQLSGITTVGLTLVRLDLPARPDRPDAFVIAYVDRSARVVVRAEASRVPGETSASLALASADRDQPVRAFPMSPFPRHRHPRPIPSDFDDVSF